MADFKHIPILSLSAASDPATKPQFLADLREALLKVGFLYLSDIPGLPRGGRLVEQTKEECVRFFDALSEEEKRAIEMKNEKSFLGWSRLGNEITAGASDWREQLDLSTPHATPPPDAPAYENLRGPNQWPSSDTLPNFRPVYEEYMRVMSPISLWFTSLIAEAIGLPADAFDRFFDKDQQHKLKLVKYPDGGAGAGQGVGPHKDSMLTSYLLQASKQKGLQVQNVNGEWIDCPPIDGTLVVAIGQGMEAITEGVCASTTHRVLSPKEGDGPRYSIPFFQGVSFHAKFESMDVPEDVKALKKQIVDANGGRQDDVEFTFVKGQWENLGEATLWNRCKSHQDVSERWYPDILAKIREQQAAPAKKSLSSTNAIDSDISRQKTVEAH